MMLAMLTTFIENVKEHFLLGLMTLVPIVGMPAGSLHVGTPWTACSRALDSKDGSFSAGTLHLGKYFYKQGFFFQGL